MSNFPPNREKGAKGSGPGETRYPGERQSQTLKPNPAREMHPDTRMTTSDQTRKGTRKH
jgi:hypothetical protein